MFVVRSKDKTSGDSSNFKIKLDYPYGLKNIKRICLKEITMPAGFYNIRTDVNDSFVFKVGTSGSTNYTVTLDPGSYTVDSLMTALQTGINATASGLTVAVTQDATSHLMLITVSAGGDFCIPITTSTAFPTRATGFEDYSTSGTYVTTGGKIPDCSYPTSIGVLVQTQTGGFGEYIRTTSSKDNFSFFVPITGNFGSVMFYNPEQEGLYQEVKFSTPRDIYEFDVSLWLDNAEAANINGLEWEMVWLLYD